MWRAFALLLAVGLVVAAEPEKKDAKKDPTKDAKKDADKKSTGSLEGTWSASVTTNAGKRIKALAGYETILTLNKDGSYTTVIRNQTVDAGTYKTDAKKDPMEIDMESTKGADKGKKTPGIYELNDNKLKIALATAGEKERPTKFESDTIRVLEFTKKK
jgi:uncharacterized protein (TIGR03067 family)